MAERFDGFFNAFIGHGTHGRDPFSNYIYTPSRMMTDWECADMFTYNGIAQKIITAPADEAVKEGFTLKDGEAEMEEQTKAVLSVMEDLEWEQRFSEALSWDRLYGGSAVLMMADDGTAELSEPLNPCEALSGLLSSRRRTLRPATPCCTATRAASCTGGRNFTM